MSPCETARKRKREKVNKECTLRDFQSVPVVSEIPSLSI